MGPKRRCGVAVYQIENSQRQMVQLAWWVLLSDKGNKSMVGLVTVAMSLCACNYFASEHDLHLCMLYV